jgi:hypothetical protein
MSTHKLLKLRSYEYHSHDQQIFSITQDIVALVKLKADLALIDLYGSVELAQGEIFV